MSAVTTEAWSTRRTVPGLLDRLGRALPVTALGVRGARTAEIAHIALASGHDVIWIDLEHSTMPIDTAAQICHAALAIGLVALVRTPEREYGAIGRLLDGGAAGVIAPRIESAAQAKDIVAACRFPPLGHRSAIATLPLVGYAKLQASELYHQANRGTLVKILIESPAGLDNLDEIAAVEGVDMIGIGTNDLSAELGVPGDFRHPRVRGAHDAALAACRRAGKPLAIGGIGDARYAAELIGKGAAPFLFTGTDTDLLLTAAQARQRAALASLEAPSS